MAGYIGTQPVPQATQTRDAFTCTAGQTSFATSGYTPGFLDVYLNGIKLAAADYTASNGSDVVLASGAALDDILEVVAYTSFEVVTDTVTNAGTVLNLDRTGSDGTILDLKKDGTTVGSIGAEGGKLYIDSSGGVEGKLKNQGSVSYLWHSNYFTSVNDNATDLGMGDLRFKDLYLSGGVYLGGTGAANKLDDYEEGLWTPVLNTGSFSSVSGTYTKIGNLVRITFAADIGTGGGYIIYGLPFTPADTTGFTPYFAAQDLPTGCLGMGWAIGAGAPNIYVRSYRDNATFVQTGLTGGAQIHVDFTYRTTA